MATRLSPTSRLGPLGIPALGIGTWMAPDDELHEALRTAIETGYRHIDTAYVYGNERTIGDSLQRIMAEGLVKREELFIVTKLPIIAMRPEHVETYLKRSLEALQLSYIDLYLIHVPVAFQNTGIDILFPRDEKGEILIDMETDHVAIWKAMETQVDAGRTRHIGLSNFNLRQTKRLLENSRIPPSNNQLELHVYLQQRELVSYCLEHGVTVTAYAPLGSAHLSAFDKLVSGKTDGKTKYVPLEDPVVVDIAKKHHKTPAQVLLRYLLECGVAVIPKSSNPQRIKENFNVFDFVLSEEDVQRLRSLDKGEDGRMFIDSNDLFLAMKRHPEYPWRN